ncbi:hypothetical protein G7011_00270 [Pseudomonas plecoglossicida]|uniref:hypothetical protein n=1 Tax=Pseudomonas plecoglossicida TaxID=70775 RepID=UPI0015E29867|nr:hypothetical protein [Pseudomonas plecoglossicida]MBA1195547.1 hypothetical protein [Pseudomonas plecoglossicida]
MSKVIVTFEKNWRGYAAGEIAGFESNLAEGLIEGGYAVEADKKSSKKSRTGASGGAATDDAGGDGEAAAKMDTKPDTNGKP